MSGAFFFPSVVPGKRHSADCQGLGESACQNLFLTLQPEPFFRPRQVKQYIFRITA